LVSNAVFFETTSLKILCNIMATGFTHDTLVQRIVDIINRADRLCLEIKGPGCQSQILIQLEASLRSAATQIQTSYNACGIFRYSQALIGGDALGQNELWYYSQQLETEVVQRLQQLAESAAKPHHCHRKHNHHCHRKHNHHRHHHHHVKIACQCPVVICYIHKRCSHWRRTTKARLLQIEQSWLHISSNITQWFTRTQQRLGAQPLVLGGGVDTWGGPALVPGQLPFPGAINPINQATLRGVEEGGRIYGDAADRMGRHDIKLLAAARSRQSSPSGSSTASSDSSQ